MLEKELKNNQCSCGNGKEIDEYLACTICEADEEVEDVSIPEDESYEDEVYQEETSEKDPEDEGKHYL